MSPECPNCASNDTEPLYRVNPFRPGGPGEEYVYQCRDCGDFYTAYMPEPDDGYEGDGVFAANH